MLSTKFADKNYAFHSFCQCLKRIMQNKGYIILSYYINFWVGFFDFANRTTRREFWLTFTTNVVIILVLINRAWSIVDSEGEVDIGAVKIFYLLIAIPSIAMGVRRLRDAGFSPWWIFLGLFPVLGWIITLILYLYPTKEE